MKNVKYVLVGFMLFFCGFNNIQAQTYLIDFTASGTSGTLDSIYVENLTQGSSITLSADDTLKLIGSAAIESTSADHSSITVFPNPINDNAVFEFFSETPLQASIVVYDVIGKTILNQFTEIKAGKNTFQLSGFRTGHYQLVVKGAGLRKSAAFVSLYNSNAQPQIHSTGDIINPSIVVTKSARDIIQLPFNNGDQFIYIGYSGNYSEHIYEVPTSTKTVNFAFSSASCGGSFTDTRDNTSYSSVRIGKQCWMKENLKYLPEVVGPTTGSTTIPYFYVYAYNGTSITEAQASQNYQTYGVLYNWPAAMNGDESSTLNPSQVQGICPSGWHLPSGLQWAELTEFLGGDNVAAVTLKATTHWATPNTNTNQSGFSALPGGIKYYDGAFYLLTVGGDWWTSTEENENLAVDRNMNYDSDVVAIGNFSKSIGASVRCVKN